MLSVSKVYSIDDRMINVYGAAVGIIMGRGDLSIQRKPAPVPLCPPQVPHDLTWDHTRATTVGSQNCGMAFI
jgi:hypothetical protein